MECFYTHDIRAFPIADHGCTCFVHWIFCIFIALHFSYSTYLYLGNGKYTRRRPLIYVSSFHLNGMENGLNSSFSLIVWQAGRWVATVAIRLRMTDCVCMTNTRMWHYICIVGGNTELTSVKFWRHLDPPTPPLLNFLLSRCSRVSPWSWLRTRHMRHMRNSTQLFRPPIHFVKRMKRFCTSACHCHSHPLFCRFV